VKIGIRLRIVAISGIAITLILLTSYLFLYTIVKVDTIGRIKADLLKETALARAYFGQYLSQNSLSYSADNIADKISNDLGVQVTIVGRYGTIVGDSELDGNALRGAKNVLDAPEVQAALRSEYGSARRKNPVTGATMLYVASAFGTRGIQGIIRLAYPLSAVAIISNPLRNAFIIALFATILFSLLAVALVSAQALRPVEKIARISRSLTGSNLQARISCTSNDEAKDIAEVINHFSGEAQLKDEEISSGESRLEATLRSMSHGAALIDSNGSIMSINEPLENLMNITKVSLGKKPGERIQNSEIQKILDRVLTSRTGVTSGEISVAKPKKRKILISGAPVLRHGKTDGAVLVFHELTKNTRLLRPKIKHPVKGTSKKKK